MEYAPLPQRFLEAVDRHPTPRAMLYKADERWEPISSAELLRRVAGLAHALVEQGIGSGDRVGLFAPNRPEWHIADFAVLGIGAVDVPVYFNDSPDRITYILNDAEARAVIVAGEEQAQRLAECRARLPRVEQYIVAGAPPETLREALRFETLVAAGNDAHIAEYRRRATEVRSDQLATLIYTSGTTGEPKGVMLTHRNLSSNDMDSTGQMAHYPDDVGLSFLPLSHVYERIIDYGYLLRGIPVAYVERPEQVQAALREVQPSLIAAVPRVFEKIYAGIVEKGKQLTGWRRAMFDWAGEVAREAAPWRCYGKPVGWDVKVQWWLANLLAYAKIRAAMGGRLRSCSSGAAPLALDLLEFFWTVGVPIYQGYGLTETSPVVSTNQPGHNKIGTVGPPIPNVEVRIAVDGEILVRGPCVMQGYYKKPGATREALDADGWLRTGDLGRLDADGYLSITDRKKELLKTAAGKFIAPQPLENQLKQSPLISNAVVIGDRRKHVVALIVPNFAALEAPLRTDGLAMASRSELAAHPRVRQMIEREVDEVNRRLAQYETIKRFAILDHDFSFQDGEITYTMKLKRRVIEQRYQDVIESLYEQ